MSISREDKKRLYGALRSELNNLSVQNIRNTVAAAGFDVSQITAKAEARSGLGSRAEVMPAVDRLFGQMSESVHETALRIFAERLTEHNPDLRIRTQDILGRHGYQFIDGNFIAVHELDTREARFVPESAANELGRAMSRLIDDDYSGAITSACGAVGLLTQDIYEKQDLGNPGHASFQTKVNTALNRLGVFKAMSEEFVSIGMKPEDVSAAVDQIKKGMQPRGTRSPGTPPCDGRYARFEASVATDGPMMRSNGRPRSVGFFNAMSEAGIQFMASRLCQYVQEPH